jgi:hypothetical protein
LRINSASEMPEAVYREPVRLTDMRPSLLTFGLIDATSNRGRSGACCACIGTIEAKATAMNRALCLLM